MSAHIDHLGIGKAIAGDAIFNGAMDDASGVASMLDIAARLRETAPRLKRSVLFVAVTGEEKGLLGSKYFAAHPTVARSSIAADLNADMFLPLYPLKILNVYGLEESSLGDDVRAIAAGMGIRVQPDPEPRRNIFIRSDQYSFILQGVPSLMLAFGNEKGSKEAGIEKQWLSARYHAPSDDVNQPVDKEAAGVFDDLFERLIARVANADMKPAWKRDSFFRRYAAR
jgi:Zn-dependent M28 family amino/carboxypeptidase